MLDWRPTQQPVLSPHLAADAMDTTTICASAYMTPSKRAVEAPLTERMANGQQRPLGSGALSQPSSEAPLHSSADSSSDDDELDHENARGEGMFESGRTRWRPSEDEKRILYVELQKNAYPDVATKDGLARRMGVARPQISKWFQHRREVLSKATGFVGYVQRARRTAEQRALLDKSFEIDPYPSAQTVAELVEKLELSPKQVKLWFKHRRHAKIRVAPPTSPTGPILPARPASSSPPLIGISPLIYSSNCSPPSLATQKENCQSPPSEPSNVLAGALPAHLVSAASPPIGRKFEAVSPCEGKSPLISGSSIEDKGLARMTTPASDSSAHGSMEKTKTSDDWRHSGREDVVHDSTPKKSEEARDFFVPSLPLPRVDLSWPVHWSHQPQQYLPQAAQGQQGLPAVALPPPPMPGDRGLPFQLPGTSHIQRDYSSGLAQLQRSSLAAVAICCGPWQPPRDVAERLGNYLGLSTESVFAWFTSDEASQIARMYVRRPQHVEYPLPAIVVPHLVHVPMHSQSVRLEPVSSFPSDFASKKGTAQGSSHPIPQ
jgi:Homeodomain